MLTRAGTNPEAAFKHVASAARTANRVVAVTQGEVENTEDLEFRKGLEGASTGVTKCACFVCRVWFVFVQEGSR